MTSPQSWPEAAAHHHHFCERHTSHWECFPLEITISRSFGLFVISAFSQDGIFFKLVFWIAACLRLEIPVHDSRPKIIHHKPRFIDTVGFNLTPPVLTLGLFFFSKRVTGCKVYYSCHAVIYNTLMLGEGERSRDREI